MFLQFDASFGIDWEDNLTTLFLIFSILFLVMTLSAYAFEKSLRDHLHGKMTVVFLCNLTICFFVAVLSWFEVAPRSSKSFNEISVVTFSSSCLSVQGCRARRYRLYFFRLPHPVFLPRLLLQPQRHRSQHLFAFQHVLR